MRAMKQIPIFKAGRHIAANGGAVQFSEDDLARSVAAYDPKVHEAPIVIGHPKDNHPAWGWVSGLSFAEGEVVADVGQVDPQFAEMVQAGRFKKRSASFYTPDAPTNPVPGVYYLRHVGFLGAQPPAVKGLGDVQFAEDDGVVEFAEDAVTVSIMARMVRGLRDALLAKWGQDETEKALPGYLVEDLEAEARRMREAPPEPSSPMFTENPEEGETSMTAEQIAEMEALKAKAAQVEALEAKVAEYAEAQAKAARDATLAGFKAELAPLVTAGKVLPAEVDALAEFMAKLDDSIEVAEFAEGEAQRTQLAFFRSELAKRPVAVDFSERAGGTPDDSPASAADLGAKARAYREAQAAAGRTISFTEATDAVLRGAAA